MPTPEKVLHDLLCELFVGDAAGLVQHVSLHLGPRFAAQLPSSGVGLAQLAFAVQRAARRHGVQRDLFVSLAEERPAQVEVIAAVASRFSIALHGRAEAKRSPPSGATVGEGSSQATGSPSEGGSAASATMRDDKDKETWDVFISYSRAELGWVERLAENLHQLGLRVFFDEWEIGHGDVVNHRIDAGLRGSTNGILVASDHALQRPFVAQEYAALLNKAVRGQKLIPVLYNLSDTSDLPAQLGTRQWVDFRGKDGDEYIALVRGLAESLKGGRKGPPPRDGVIRPPGGSSVGNTSRPATGVAPSATSASEYSASDTSRSAPSGANVGAQRGRSPAGDGLSWLHLSDLHLEGGDTYDCDVVLEAVVDLVRSERPQRAPDFIVVTGDIAFSGRAAEYGKATAFFSDLLDAAGLADRRERLVVVPGNHDVDRRALRGLARTLRDESDSQDYFSADHPRHHFVGQANYRAWHDDFFAGVGRRAPTDTTCGPLVRLELGSATVAILPINTALFARDEHDHNKLWVGRRALRGPAKALRAEPASLRVVAMHHPVEWLCDAERAQIRGALRGPADLILTGHLHEADAARVITTSTEALHVAAGAAYQGSSYPCRLFYGRLEGPTIRLRPYCYADNIERWVVDASVFPGARDFEGVFPRPPR